MLSCSEACGRLLLVLFVSSCFSGALASKRVDQNLRGETSKVVVASRVMMDPIFVAPQLTPKQFLIISSPVDKKIVYTELKNFKSSTGRTFALIDSGLVDPRGMSLDRDRGALYIADKGAKKIYRYHVYKEEDSNGQISLITDGVQLVVADADTEWVHVDVNGDVFYSDAARKNINRIPVGVVELLAKGQYSSSELTVVSQKKMMADAAKAANGTLPPATDKNTDEAAHIYSVYENRFNPHVGFPSGVVSDGIRLYWTNSKMGKSYGTVAQGEVDPVAATAAAGKLQAFPSMSLSNKTDVAYGIAKSAKLLFYSTDNGRGLGSVDGISTGGDVFSFAKGLAAPRGLAWDGDQTMFVADSSANCVYSFPIGRLIEGAPLTTSARLGGAYGIAIFGENDRAWYIEPMAASGLNDLSAHLGTAD